MATNTVPSLQIPQIPATCPASDQVPHVCVHSSLYTHKYPLLFHLPMSASHPVYQPTTLPLSPQVDRHSPTNQQLSHGIDTQPWARHCKYKTKDVVPISSAVRQTRGGSLPYVNDDNREVISVSDKGLWPICMRTERSQEKCTRNHKGEGCDLWSHLQSLPLLAWWPLCFCVSCSSVPGWAMVAGED